MTQPGWPPPTPYPPPGYYYWPPPPPPRQPPPLDATMAALRAEDDRPWGWRPVVVPLAALATLIVATFVLGTTVRAHSDQQSLAYAVSINVAVEVLLAVAVWFAGKDVAARYGGWGRTFGLRAPRLADIPYVSAGFAIALGARFIIAIGANVLTRGPGRTGGGERQPRSRNAGRGGLADLRGRDLRAGY